MELQATKNLWYMSLSAVTFKPDYFLGLSFLFFNFYFQWLQQTCTVFTFHHGFTLAFHCLSFHIMFVERDAKKK